MGIKANKAEFAIFERKGLGLFGLLSMIKSRNKYS